MIGDARILMGQLNRMEGMLKKLIGSDDPTVDFIVDKFDRSDSSTLGVYWTTGYAWALRSGMVQPTVANSASRTPRQVFNLIQDGWQSVSGLFNYAHASIGCFLGGTFSSGAPSASILSPATPYGLTAPGAVYASYKAKMSSGSYTVAVDFYVSETPPLSASSSPDTTTTYDDAKATQAGIFMSVSNAYQVVMGYGASIPAMHCTQNTPATVISGTDVPAASASLSTPSAMLGEFAVGNLAGLATGNLLPDTSNTLSGIIGSGDNNPSIPSTIALSVSALTFLIKVGSNRIMVVTNGTNITVTLNGTQLYAGAPGYVVGANIVGICTDAVSTLGFGGGITSFKAWVSTMNEPPNETGRGTYKPDASAATQYQYADKYHTPTYDSSRTQTGYAYNPGA